MAIGDAAGFAQGQLLAQVRPSVTTPVAAFTVPASPAGLRVEIMSICVFVATAGNKDIVIYHDDEGLTFDSTTAIIGVQRASFGDPVAFAARTQGGGIHIKPGGTIAVQSSVADVVNFSLYGITETIAVERIRPR
jgi:hypothetical protein